MKRKYLVIFVVIIFILAVLIYFFRGYFSSGESFVKREFSGLIISSGEIIDVTLFIEIGNYTTFYAIEENVPKGWVIIDDNGGETANPQRLAWAVFGAFPLKDSSIKYSVQAPSTIGEYTFSGIYQFEGMSNSIATKGDTTITVA